MKKKDTVAKSVNTFNTDKKKELIGIVNIFQLMDLVVEEQNYLEMLQTNGLKATEGKRGIGDESATN
jgi:hypothetical protein